MILRYLGRHKWAYLGGIITLFVVDYLNLYIPEFTGYIADGLLYETTQSEENPSLTRI